MYIRPKALNQEVGKMVRRVVKRVRNKATSCQDTGDISRLIEERAYHIWESKGKPQNNALDNWLEAK